MSPTPPALLENPSHVEDLLKSLLVCAKRGQAGQIVERLSIKTFVEVLEDLCEKIQLTPAPTELDTLKSFSAPTGALRSNEYESFSLASDAAVKVFLEKLPELNKTGDEISEVSKNLLTEFPPEELNEKPCEGCEGCTNRFCEKRWE